MAKTQGKIPAPLAALEAITKGCNRPLEDGLKIEAEAFIPLVGSPVSKNLIAVFFMNQRIQKDPGVEDPSIQPKNVNNVGVLGAGIMGSGIAGAHIRRAVPTLMIDQDTSAIDKGVSAIGKVMKSRIDIGRMTEEDMFAALARLSTATNTKLLAEADVIVEAVVENESVKTELFKQLHDVVKDDAIVASNTSTISITRMAQAAPNPSRFAGMHFFNPVDRMPLVEVIRGEKTDDHTVATLVALAKRIGKSPIVVRDCPGFLVNRVLFPYLNEALFLLEEGADPRTVDKVATDFGMPMGPITLHDVVGLDTSLYAGQVIKTAYPDRAVESNILDHLVKIGRLGKKSGAGFYNYAKSSRGTDDAQLTQILDACRTDRRDISTNEISDRLFLSMLVESSRALSEEIVRTPADVDMGLVLGIGFPTFLGGILRWADAVGLATVVDKLKPFQKLGKRFEPTEQMAELAAARKGFYDT